VHQQDNDSCSGEKEIKELPSHMQRTNPAINEVSSVTEYISLITSIIFGKGFPMALWRLPGQQSSHLIAANTFHYLSKDSVLEELPPGFIFSPFRNDKPGILITRDLSFSFENNSRLAPATPLEIASLAWLKECQKSMSVEKIRFEDIQGMRMPTNEKDHYLNLVKLSIERIELGEFEKVVPSRMKKIPLRTDFDPVRTFQNLCSDHPNALVSFVHLPGIGSWIGASPEVLVSVENGSIFRTVALAATQTYDKEVVMKSVAWTQKEIEEQALVERYIISCFKKIRLREYDEHGPKTVAAGKLIHLRSDFTVDMKATNFPQLGSVMLRLLHPTSAVCGMALEPARAFLLEREGYDREFYTGYLGPVNIDHNTDIYVNLRCMKLTHDHALLYAGAGVTSDSIPEKEWEETEVKFNTLSTSLGQRVVSNHK
jgi:isochorismate synthase